MDLEFDWDNAKHERNITDRGFGFDVAAYLFDGPVVEWEDTRENYGERRMIALGTLNDRVFVCVYTDRVILGSRVRHIISLRKGNRRDSRRYYEDLQRQASG